MATQSLFVTKRLGELLSKKSGQRFAEVMGWIRCRLSFAILRSTLACVLGSRGFKQKNEEVNLDLAISQVLNEKE